MIPITKPYFDNKEAAAVREVISSGWVAQGPKVKQFEDAFASYAGSRHACAVSSCTSALYIALRSVGVQPGDVVITVSHSFIATANSVRHCGAEPVFIDIDMEDYNMSPAQLGKCLDEDCEKRNGRLFYKKTSQLFLGESPLKNFVDKRNAGRVAAILPVHQMGMPCKLKEILSLAAKFNIPVVEDAACAIGSEISLDGGKAWHRVGRPHGDIACFSFHPRKLITTGEGGMLTTNNPSYDKRFRLLRQHGMSISDVKRHNAKKVIFEEYLTTGYNYRMSDIQAAVGIEQLKKASKMIEKRRKLATIYSKRLKYIKYLKPPLEPSYCKTNWQSYPVMLSDNAPVKRDGLMQVLLKAGISTRRGIMNAHQEKPYRSGIALKNSESARDSAILLPIFNEMREEEICYVVNVIKGAIK